MPAYSRILLPWDSQPQDACGVDSNDPLSSGLLVASSIVQGPGGIYNALGRNHGILNGATSRSVGSPGVVIDSVGTTGNYVNFEYPPDWDAQPHAFTVSLLARYSGTPALRNLFNLNHGTAANHQSAICYWDSVASARYMLMQTGGTAGDAARSVILSSNPDVTLWHLWHFSWDGTSNRGKIYCDGRDLTANGAVGLTPQYNNAFDIGRGVVNLNGPHQFAGVWLWDKQLSAGDAALHWDRVWRTFAPRSIPIPVSAGGGGVNLVIADSAHAHAADNLGLTLDTYLALQDALHAHAADNLGLTLDTYLAVNEALHAHTADNLTLSTTGATNLTVADAAHAHAADNLGLTLDTYLTIAEALHAHAADNVVLSTGAVANLVIADGAHAHAADNLAFTLDTWLAIADALHAHGADNLILTLLSNLTIADTTHAHTADNVVLAFPLGALSDAEFRQMYDWLNELALIHGLIAASPMTVTPTTRSAGAVSQTIGEVGTTITVTRT